MNPPNIVLRRASLPAILGISIAQIDRIRKQPDSDFPTPIRFGPQSLGFFSADIAAWLEARKEKKVAVQ